MSEGKLPPMPAPRTFATGVISHRRVELRGWTEDDLRPWLEKLQEAPPEVVQCAFCGQRTDNPCDEPPATICPELSDKLLAEQDAKRAREVLSAVIYAWEALRGGRHHDSSTIERWLRDDMSPAIDAARKFLGREAKR